MHYFLNCPLIEVKLCGPLFIGAPLVGGWFCIIAIGNVVGAWTLARY